MILLNSLQLVGGISSARRDKKFASAHDTTAFLCLVFSLMMLFNRAAAEGTTGDISNLRRRGGGEGTTEEVVQQQQQQQRSSRELLPHWLCSFFDDTIDHRCDDNNNENNSTNIALTCPVVEPLANDPSIFDLTNFTSHSWFVQKQQINGFQPSVETDFFCLVHTFSPRFEKKEEYEEEGRAEDDGSGGTTGGPRFMDYIQYGTIGQVNGPQQEWDVGDNNLPPSMNTWCGGQDEDGGGLLRIAPCFFRSLLAKVGFPMWVIKVSHDYSWAIISGGEPKDMVQTNPVPLCTTRTEINADILADSSGTGLWLLTKERIASNETIAIMEDTLTEMGIYTGMLYPVQQEGCTYDNSGLIEEGDNNNNNNEIIQLERDDTVEVDRDGDDDDWL